MCRFIKRYFGFIEYSWITVKVSIKHAPHMYSFVESQIDNSISLNSFCGIHGRFALKKQLWKDEPIDCDREYTFSFIPVYNKIPKLTKDAIFKDHNYYHKPGIDILFNQYQNLKNQKNKINFNSQGEGDESGY